PLAHHLAELWGLAAGGPTIAVRSAAVEWRARAPRVSVPLPVCCGLRTRLLPCLPTKDLPAWPSGRYAPQASERLTSRAQAQSARSSARAAQASPGPSPWRGTPFLPWNGGVCFARIALPPLNGSPWQGSKNFAAAAPT